MTLTKFIPSAILALIFSATGYGAELTIRCMEMASGVPQAAVIYRLLPTGELVSDNNGNKPISSFKKMFLSKTSNDQGETKTFAQHAWIKKDETLRRTVSSIPAKKSHAKPSSFSEIYDFKNQTVKDKTGEDTCHHDLSSKTP